MIVNNKWKQVLSKKGMTQLQVAQETFLAPPFFSNVVNGVSLLSWTELQRICGILGIKPQDVYGSDIMKVVYGKDDTKQKPLTASVKLFGEEAKEFIEARDTYGYKKNSEFALYAVRFLKENGDEVFAE